MINTRMLIVLVVFGLSLSFGITTYSKTPDGMTPAEETVCDGLHGAAFGLCNAYCEAMDCDSDDPHASDRACERVLGNYQKKTGTAGPPCVCDDICVERFEVCTNECIRDCVVTCIEETDLPAEVCEELCLEDRSAECRAGCRADLVECGQDCCEQNDSCPTPCDERDTCGGECVDENNNPGICEQLAPGPQDCLCVAVDPCETRASCGGICTSPDVDRVGMCVPDLDGQQPCACAFPPPPDTCATQDQCGGECMTVEGNEGTCVTLSDNSCACREQPPSDGCQDRDECGGECTLPDGNLGACVEPAGGICECSPGVGGR